MIVIALVVRKRKWFIQISKKKTNILFKTFLYLILTYTTIHLSVQLHFVYLQNILTSLPPFFFVCLLLLALVSLNFKKKPT